MRLLRTLTGTQFAMGKRIPWYLGRCYYQSDNDFVILAPIPLNFLIGWGYEAFWRIRRGPEGLRLRLEQARAAGFREGLEAGKMQALSLYEQAIKWSARP